MYTSGRRRASPGMTTSRAESAARASTTGTGVSIPRSSRRIRKSMAASSSSARHARSRRPHTVHCPHRAPSLVALLTLDLCTVCVAQARCRFGASTRCSSTVRPYTAQGHTKCTPHTAHVPSLGALLTGFTVCVAQAASPLPLPHLPHRSSGGSPRRNPPR